MKPEIFVFGSNREGRHGRGAALYARQKYGAIYGQASGRQGNSYAIITKELRPNYPKVTLEDIQLGLLDFARYTVQHPEYHYLFTRIGCGLAGFDWELQMWPAIARTLHNNLRIRRELNPDYAPEIHITFLSADGKHDDNRIY